MIYDSHTHLNNYAENRPRPLQESLDLLLESMRRNGVDYANVLTSYRKSEHRPSVGDVVAATRDLKNVFVVAGISFLNYRLSDLREIREYLDDGLVRGMKLYPGYEPFYPHDSRCRVIYELAAEYDVPVMIHSGDTYNPKGKVRFAHPIHVDDVAVDHPETKLVICHIGNPWIRDCMEVVYKNKNVYADISGLVLGDFSDAFERYMRNQVREMILYAGEPRYLLYGTDWPLARMKTYLDFMRELRLKKGVRELIMWENAARLFKVDTGLPLTPDPAPDRMEGVAPLPEEEPPAPPDPAPPR